MRLEKIKNIPRIIIYLGLTFLLVLLLAVSGNVGDQSKSQPVKSTSEQTQTPSKVANESETDSDIDTVDPEPLAEVSLYTRVKVSLKTNISNNTTTGSSKVEITQNGETEIIDEDFDEATDGNSFRIKVNDGEVDFDFDFDQDTKEESSVNQKIKIKNETD